MLLYAGYKECTIHLLAGMPVCYIYSQQRGRQPSCPMAGRTNMKDKKLEEAIDYVWLFGGFCGRDSGIGPAQRAKTTIWN